MIDVKDLMKFTASELKVGGVFYIKNDDGTFSRCRIDEGDLKDGKRKAFLSSETARFSKEGRLFRRINKPWKGFE